MCSLRRRRPSARHAPHRRDDGSESRDAAEARHIRRYSIQWFVAGLFHLAISFFFLALMRKPLEQQPPCLARLRTRSGLRLALLLWYTAMISTLGYLNAFSKVSRGDVYPGALTEDTEALLLEYSRSTNYSTSLIAIVALSFFMHGVRASYNEAAAATGVMMAATLVSWVIQSSKVDLFSHSGFMWTMLLFTLVAALADFFLVRSGEVVRRRLFHLMQVLDTQNTMLRDQNEELRAIDEMIGEDEADIDLESPLLKVRTPPRGSSPSGGTARGHSACAGTARAGAQRVRGGSAPPRGSSARLRMASARAQPRMARTGVRREGQG